MIETICCIYDVVALTAGGVLLWRARWRGVWQEVAMLGAGATLVMFGAAVVGGTFGGFAMLRGLCHGLFCAVLPLLALRAVRIRSQCASLAALLGLVFAAGEGCYLWALHVEPFRLEVTTARITSPRLAQQTPLRVALVADLQADAITAFEVEVFDSLVDARPDLVLFLGDYLQAGSPAFEREIPKLHAQLARLHPRLGSFAVDGDVDARGANGVFAGTHVRVVVDERVELPGVPIDVIGLSRAKSRAPFVDAGVVRRLGGERFPIVIGHAPDFMLAVLRDGLRADALFVAGHTHGGQVQVPWFGPVVTLSSVPRWLAGGGVFQRGDTWLVCSRGIGMERGDAPRVRFWCRPQLLLLDLCGI